MLDDLNMSVKPPFLVVCIFVLYLPGIIGGYAFGYQNNLTPCIEAKYGWAKGRETWVHMGVLGSSLIFGMIIGAVSSGFIQ